MHWKNWPYWLRGGVIGGLVLLVSYALTNLCIFLIAVPGYDGFGLECLLPFGFLWFPFAILGGYLSLQYGELLFVVSITIIYFLVGSIIGAIVGAVKKKKSPLA